MPANGTADWKNSLGAGIAAVIDSFDQEVIPLALRVRLDLEGVYLDGRVGQICYGAVHVIGIQRYNVASAIVVAAHAVASQCARTANRERHVSNHN